MKATLTFDLPVEQYDYDCAIDGHNYKSVLRAFDESLRGQLKYGHVFKSADEALRHMRQTLNDMLTEERLDIHD